MYNPFSHQMIQLEDGYLEVPLEAVDLANSLGVGDIDRTLDIFRGLSRRGLLDPKVVRYAVRYAQIPCGDEKRLLPRNAIALSLALRLMPKTTDNSHLHDLIDEWVVALTKLDRTLFSI